MMKRGATVWTIPLFTLHGCNISLHQITAGSKTPSSVLVFLTGTTVLTVMRGLISAGSTSESNVVFRKHKKQLKNRIFFKSRRNPAGQSQVMQFFARKMRTSRPTALEPSTSCFACSSPNYSTCKMLVSIWDICSPHFMSLWF